MDGRLRAVRSSAAASVEHTTALVGGVGRRRGTEPPVTRCRPAVCRNTCGSGREGPAPQALPDPGVETPDPVAGEPKHPGDGRAWFLKGDGGGSSTGGGPGADPAVERGTGPSEHADGAPTPDSMAVRVGGSSNSPGGGAGGGRGEGTRRSVPGAHGSVAGSPALGGDGSGRGSAGSGGVAAQGASGGAGPVRKRRRVEPARDAAPPSPSQPAAGSGGRGSAGGGAGWGWSGGAARARRPRRRRP
jgi:hypothetical protein